MTDHRVCNYINTTATSSGARTAYTSGAHGVTPVYSGVRVTRFLVLYVCFIDRLCVFVLFPLATVFSVLLQYMYIGSDCPFGIVKCF
jgi:hypothetical protein